VEHIEKRALRGEWPEDLGLDDTPDLVLELTSRSLWARADSADYVDWGAARKVVFPKLKPTQKTISLRLPAMMLAELKLLANKRDVPYQSLLKIFLAERIKKELRAEKN
jgi:predicted DNA binding CopG/RHH family protein